MSEFESFLKAYAQWSSSGFTYEWEPGMRAAWDFQQKKINELEKKLADARETLNSIFCGWDCECQESIKFRGEPQTIKCQRHLAEDCLKRLDE